MTNELEKQFFQCFGIEPKVLIFKTMNCTCGCHDCKNCDKYKNNFSKTYPQITDRILLELICFNNSHYVTLEDLICPKNIETIKESVLRKYIERNKEFVDNGYSGFGLDKVRTLFEEG